MRIAICDDIPLYMNMTLSLMEAYQEERGYTDFNIHCFLSAEQVLERLSEGERFDMYLLDIIMDNTDGISLAQEIRKIDDNVPLIFITQSSTHALDAFGVSAAQYIVKPIKKDVLFSILDKIFATQPTKFDNFTTVNSQGRVVTLAHSSIIMVENAGRSLRYHLESGNTVASKAIRTTFEGAITGLMRDGRFLWVHQSYVINMDYVKEMTNRLFRLTNGREVAIPRPKFASVKRAYLKYIADKK